MPAFDYREEFGEHGGFRIRFELDAEIKKIKRKRYSYWEALSDIGGFYDGLKLCINLLNSPLSSLFFFLDLSKGGMFAKK